MKLSWSPDYYPYQGQIWTGGVHQQMGMLPVEPTVGQNILKGLVAEDKGLAEILGTQKDAITKEQQKAWYQELFAYAKKNPRKTTLPRCRGWPSFNCCCSRSRGLFKRDG